MRYTGSSLISYSCLWTSAQFDAWQGNAQPDPLCQGPAKPAARTWLARLRLTSFRSSRSWCVPGT